MSDAASLGSGPGRELLDQSDWYMQTTGLLPVGIDATSEQLEITCLSFSLTNDERAAFDALTRDFDSPSFKYAASWLIQEAAGLDTADSNTVSLYSSRLPSRDDPRSLESLLGSYVDSLTLNLDRAQFVDALAEFRVPVFGSPAETLETIATLAGAASGILGGVGTLATAGSVLAIIGATTGAVLGIGAGVIGAGLLIRKLIQKRRERQSASPAPTSPFLPHTPEPDSATPPASQPPALRVSNPTIVALEQVREDLLEEVTAVSIELRRARLRELARRIPPANLT